MDAQFNTLDELNESTAWDVWDETQNYVYFKIHRRHFGLHLVCGLDIAMLHGGHHVTQILFGSHGVAAEC